MALLLHVAFTSVPHPDVPFVFGVVRLCLGFFVCLFVGWFFCFVGVLGVLFVWRVTVFSCMAAALRKKKWLLELP